MNVEVLYPFEDEDLFVTGFVALKLTLPGFLERRCIELVSMSKGVSVHSVATWRIYACAYWGLVWYLLDKMLIEVDKNRDFKSYAYHRSKPSHEGEYRRIFASPCHSLLSWAMRTDSLCLVVLISTYWNSNCLLKSHLNVSSSAASPPHQHHGKGSQFHKGAQRSPDSVVLTLGNMLELLKEVCRKCQSPGPKWDQFNQNILVWGTARESGCFQVCQLTVICTQSWEPLLHKLSVARAQRVRAKDGDKEERLEMLARLSWESMPRSLAPVLEALGAKKGF